MRQHSVLPSPLLISLCRTPYKKTSLSPASTMSTQCGTNATHVPSILKAVSASREVTNKERKLRQAAVCETVKSIRSRVSGTQHLVLDIAGEKGVSSWLTADPSPQCGTVLDKSDFHDAVCLRYGFLLDGVPSSCVGGSSLTTDHAMKCPAGGYPIARHNHVRDAVADVMRSAFHDVETEPLLTTISGGRSVGENS